MTTDTTSDVLEATQEKVEEMNRFVQYIQDSIPDLIGFVINVILAIVIFFIGRKLIKWLRKVVRRSLQHAEVEAGVQTFVDSCLKIGLYIFLVVVIAAKLGIDTTSVAAAVTSAGVAVGLALQGSLSNFAGGVLILVLKPFEVGDYIIEDTNKNEGTVTDIQIFYTKLNTIDNKTIVIPNGTLSNSSLTNATAREERRLDLKVTISYDSDLKKAKGIMEKILREEPRVEQNEEMNIFVDELADHGVVLGVRAWIKNDDFWPARWKILEEIKLTFDKEGIEIPYPQMTVHMAE